ncbi:VWA domain-containing protein [uncultured Thiohalocapsa sp.]|uniref:VWA domain-containing protein n=1 Tax=uncultured Thiohalocapsa sp. TaxID=768990 RepID=UPI0025D47974|nr:VWA domain-containing protein [uncultured Thiohalocapsa sp.]
MTPHPPKRTWTRLAACWLIGLLAVGAAAQATGQTPSNPAAPAEMGISQATSLGPDITLYLDVRAQNGRFVRGVSADRLSASVGEHPAAVGNVEAFDTTTGGVFYLFLVDISKSLTENEFAKIRQALSDWVNRLRPQDRVGLMTFGEAVEVVVSPTADRATLRDAIGSLAPTDNKTALHHGLAEGIKLAARRHGADLPERRVIVTLTDGVDDAPDGLGSPGVLFDLLDEEHIPIYAVFYATRSHGSDEVTEGLNALGEFSQRSGGEIIDGRGTTDLPAAFSDLNQRIMEVYKVALRCGECPLDNEPRPLLLTLQSDGFELQDRIDLRLTPDPNPPMEAEPPPPPPPTWLELYWPYLAAAVVVLLLLLIWLVLLLRRRKAAAADGSEDDDLAYDRSPDGGAGHGPDLPADAFDLGPAPPPVPPAPFQPPAQTPTPQPPPPPQPQRPANPPYRGPTASVSLAIIGGPRSGERVTLRLAPDAVIGRAPSCALSLGDDPEASSRHARIEVLAMEKQRIVLRDLDSTNGTRLNGVNVQGAQPLSSGDLIGIGQSELRVSL